MRNRTILSLRLPSVLAGLLFCLPVLSSCATPSASGGGALTQLTTRADGAYTRVASEVGAELVIPPGESLTLAELTGPAVIDRIWIGLEGSDSFWRDIVVQITWDGATSPAVEAPIGDFFAVGPGARQNLNSVPMMVQSGGRAMTSLWKMPFGESATIALVNEGSSPTRQLEFEVDYRQLDSLPSGSLLFHARYVQRNTPEKGKPVTVLRTSGEGQYVGLSLAVQNGEPGSWGNGAIQFEVDGRTDDSQRGLSLLNYFGVVFGVGSQKGAFQGSTLDEGDRTKARSTVYRFHVHDPIPFQDSIQVALDHGPENQRQDRMAAVAYWYQSETATPFERLAGVRDRRWEAPTDAELRLWKRTDQINEEVLSAYRRNDYAEATALLEELLSLEPNSVYASYNLACLYAIADDPERSLHMLGQAIDLGFSEISFARHDPDLASLHDNPRFRHLVGLDKKDAK